VHRRTKTASLIALSAVAMLSVAGCAGSAAPDSTTDQKRGPITIWYSNNESEVAWGKAMTASWNSSHPDEKVTAKELPGGKTAEEVIGAAITAGNAPCLIFNTAPSAVGQFEKQGGLVNLSDFAGADDYIKTRTGAAADNYRSADGSFYQMPWKSNPVMIFYNVDLFAKAGIDPDNPGLDTYSGFLAAAEKIKSSGAAKYAIYPSPTSEFYQPQFDFMPVYAAESGGKGIVVDKKAVFADEAGLSAANFWRDIYSKGLAGQEQYQGDAFADGTSAMSIVGPWAIAYYGDKVKWKAVPMPTSQGISADQTYTFADAKNVGMYTSCKNRATAWDVLKYATSKDQDGELLKLTGQMPLRTDITATYPDYFEANPSYTQFADQASRTIEVPSGPHTVEVLQILRDAYTKSVIHGDGDVKTEFTSAAAAANKVLAQ
jgi:multiple sugar transport system substrate-binding protein